MRAARRRRRSRWPHVDDDLPDLGRALGGRELEVTPDQDGELVGDLPQELVRGRRGCGVGSGLTGASLVIGGIESARGRDGHHPVRMMTVARVGHSMPGDALT